MLNEGESMSVVSMLYAELRPFLLLPQLDCSKTTGLDHNLIHYGKYLYQRATFAYAQRLDLGISNANGPDYANGDVASLLQDGVLEGLFALLEPLTSIAFFQDDFSSPIVLQFAQSIFDDFIYIYSALTRLLLNLFRIALIDSFLTITNPF